jgi:hypothetical protein
MPLWRTRTELTAFLLCASLQSVAAAATGSTGSAGAAGSPRADDKVERKAAAAEQKGA